MKVNEDKNERLDEQHSCSRVQALKELSLASHKFERVLGWRGTIYRAILRDMTASTEAKTAKQIYKDLGDFYQASSEHHGSSRVFTLLKSTLAAVTAVMPSE